MKARAAGSVSERGLEAADDPGLEELHSIQQFMAKALFRPLAKGDRMQKRWIDGAPMRQVTAGVIKHNDRLSSFERLEIYNRVYWYRVLDCLYEDFPALLAIIGQRRFHRLITEYLAAFPSISYTLRDLGERLPRFVEDHPELTAPRRELALEAAIFEWAQVVAFDGEVRPAFEIDAFLGSDPAHLHLGLQPYVTLLELEYPMDEFVLRLRKSEEVKGVASNTMIEGTVKKARRVRLPAPSRRQLAVHRYENALYYKTLEPAAFAILKAIGRGDSLEQACLAGAEAAEAEGNALTAEQIQRWFHDWAALGWICAAGET